ncbi:MAG TPA: MT-A70 family methyltransferase, partial [Kofleriaceae bacterium]
EGEPAPKKPTRKKHDDSTIVFNVGDRVRLAAARTSDTGSVLELVLVKGVPRARVLWDADNTEQFVDTAKLAVVETGMLAAIDRASSPLFDDDAGDSGRAAPVKFTDLCLKCGLAKHAGKCASSKKPATTTQAEAVAPAPHEALKILGYRRHPVAAVYPMMEGQAFEEFADLVQAHGLQDEIELIEVDGETWILDGSNRALACERRNVTPRFELYKGKTDLESLKLYSALKNGAGRRHLDPSIRAMIASDLAELGQGDRADRQTGQSTGLTQAEAGKKFGVSEKSVRRARVVKTKGTPKVNAAVMKGKLSVEAAEQVTKLSPKEQDAIADEALAKAEGRAVRSGRVRSLVKQQEKRDTVRKINEGRVLPPPLGPFGVIYGDYPWKYDNSDQHEGSRGHMGYPPMDFDEIIAHAREMRSRAAKDCVIALWVTNLYIPKIGAVIEAYGAEHRTMLTWPKPRAGVGTWPRGQTEHLVIASIGEPVHTLNELSTLLPAFAPYIDRAHSSKPTEVADLLTKHCSGPFLELFARAPREGWTVWGAESQKFASEAA